MSKLLKRLNRSISLYLLSCGLLFESAIHAQSTVSTPVVGFNTTTVKGVGSSGQSMFASFVPVNLSKTAVFKGSATASGTTNVLTGANITTNLNPSGGYPSHYLLINSGTGSGFFSDIVSYTANSVVTADDLSGYLSSSATVSIIPHVKLSDVLGTGSGLIITGGANVTVADNVQLVDSAGTLKVYYYKTGIGAGWKTSANTDASSLVVYPNESILVFRKQTSNVSVVQTGAVADQDTKATVSQNLNSVAGGFPLPMTLTNLTSVLSGGSSISTADNVLIANPTTGKLDVVYYKTGIGAGWKTSANSNADTSRDLSDGFLVKRKSSSPAVITQTKSW